MSEVEKIMMEINYFEKQIIEKKNSLKHLQKNCVHSWIKQTESGPYPQKWYECSKCYLVK